MLQPIGLESERGLFGIFCADLAVLARVFAAVAFVTIGASAAQVEASHIAPWSLYCSDESQPGCAIGQTTVAIGVGDVKLKVAFARDESGWIESLVRLEPAPKSGATVFIDGYDMANLNLARCDSSGCASKFVMPVPILAKLLVGKTMTVQFTLSDNRIVSLDADMVNFSAAVTALMQAEAKDLDTKAIADLVASANPTLREGFKLSIVEPSSKNAEMTAAAETWFATSPSKSNNWLVAEVAECPGKQSGANVHYIWDVATGSGVGVPLSVHDEQKLVDIAGAVSRCGSKYYVAVEKKMVETKTVYSNVDLTNSGVLKMSNTYSEINSAESLIFADALMKNGVRSDQIIFVDSVSDDMISHPDFGASKH